MQIYVHQQNTELKLIEVKETITVEELASAHGEEGATLVWIEDVEEVLEASTTLADAGIAERSHVHISRCHRITVRVRFGGDAKSREFAAGATIARVFEWATGKHGFELTPSERAKHTLGICDTLTQPDKSEHIGSLANQECSVCLDLAPKERFEG